MNKEIEQRIQRLKDRYRELGQKYGKKRFNLEKFEERYKEALKSNYDLSIFISAEEEALTQLYQETLNPVREKDKYDASFMKKVDKLLEDYEDRIKAYPYIDFHPDANEELKYLYGAIKQFYLNIFPFLEIIFGSRELGTNIIKDFSVFYGFIDYFGRDTQNGYSRRIEDHIIKIKHYSLNEVEQDYRNIMIETAQYFNKLSIFLNNQKNNIEYIDKELEVPVEIFGEKRLRYDKIIDCVIKWIDDFFYNFRIRSFI
ncbi:MAG: hypothetical protein ACK4YF_00170 [Exilispira sp.]